jgi:hypothetical protein
MQQQAMLQMLNQSGSGLPMGSMPLKPVPTNAPGPIPGPSAGPAQGPNGRGMQMQDVPLPRLQAQLTKESSEFQAFMRQLKMPGLDQAMIMRLRDGLKEKQQRIQTISAVINVKKQQAAQG